MDVARQNIAGAHAAIKFRVERDQSRKDVVAEIEFNIARDPDRNHAHPVLEHALRERNPANSAQNSKMRRSLNPRFRSIGRETHHQRLGYGKRILDRQRAESQCECAPVSPKIRPLEAEGTLHIPAHSAKVFAHSSANNLRPSRLCHQPWAVK